MIIRSAVPSDFQSILEGIRDFVAASSYHVDEVNEDHVLATIGALVESADGLVAVMEDDAGQFAGCFIGLAHAHLFSAKRLLAELFIYTAKNARGHGNKLRRFAEDWARDNECSAFLIAHPMSEAHLDKVYRRWGFEPHEVHFRKDFT